MMRMIAVLLLTAVLKVIEVDLKVEQEEQEERQKERKGTAEERRMMRRRTRGAAREPTPAAAGRTQPGELPGYN